MESAIFALIVVGFVFFCIIVVIGSLAQIATRKKDDR